MNIKNIKSINGFVKVPNEMNNEQSTARFLFSNDSNQAIKTTEKIEMSQQKTIHDSDFDGFLLSPLALWLPSIQLSWLVVVILVENSIHSN